MSFLNTFMRVVGGKRGLSVIASAVLTIGVVAGWIPEHLATQISLVAGALGVTGIVHANIKASDTP